MRVSLGPKPEAQSPKPKAQSLPMARILTFPAPEYHPACYFLWAT